MPTYNLSLSTEELKTLQCTIEDYLTATSPWGGADPTLRDVLAKITLLQCNDDPEPSPRDRAYLLDANHRPRDSEDEVAF